MSTPNDDLQQLYEDASAMQGGQPAPRVREAVLAHAAMLAQSRSAAADVAALNTTAAKTAANWPQWKTGLVASVLLVPLLGMLMLHMKDTPEWQEPIPAPTRTGAAVVARPAADAAVAPAPVAPTTPTATPQAALRKEAALAETRPREAPKVAPAAREAAPLAKAAQATGTTPTPVPAPAPAFVASPPAAPAPLPAMPARSYAPSPDMQGAVGSAASAEQRADRVQWGAGRARESVPLTSSFASAPVAAPAPAKTVMVAPGVPRPDTYLLMAAQKGDMTMVLTVLKAGASLQAQDTLGRTALMWAAIGGHLAVIQHLLAQGADRAATDNQGLTALQHAEQAGQKDAAALLE